MKVLLLGVMVLISSGTILASQQCCPDGKLIARRGCEGESTLRLNCSEGRFLLKDVFLIGDQIYTRDSDNFTFIVESSQYCLGKTYRNLSNPDLGIVPAAIICFQSSNEYEITGILTLISAVFLLFTLGVYLYLPQLRDLQGLCYISLCISMALGYLSLGVLQLSSGFKKEICTVTGFNVYFWMIATFLWMNVISVNTYRSINHASYLKKTERQHYFAYTCYAWGTAILLLFVVIITNFVEGNHWKPGIGERNCWFRGATETWIFFYGPMAVLVACNIILFVISSSTLWQQTTNKYEVHKLNNLKHKFLLSLKLFLVMGISWVFEIASFAHGKSTVFWKIMDIFNCLQGVVIFVLLVVLRRRAIRGLASENCCLAITRPLSEKLSPHDDEDEQQVLADDTMEVKLN